MDRGSVLRLSAAELPAVRGVPDRGGGSGRSRAARQGPAALLRAPARRRDLPRELRGDQPGSDSPCPGVERRHAVGRSAEPGRRCRQRAHLAVRRVRLRGRTQPGCDRRDGDLPQRAVRADPVRAGHGERARAAAPDGSAVHQQVLHPRPVAGELVRPLRGRKRPHGLHHVLAQPHRRARPCHVGRLPARRCDQGHRVGACGDRGREAERARLLASSGPKA
ncbi:MAG: hypothetical protein H6R20_465 [Proteobacteria bacterium]|nr:hypothetical protein [Pseudomonadota bacterium]